MMSPPGTPSFFVPRWLRKKGRGRHGEKDSLSGQEAALRGGVGVGKVGFPGKKKAARNELAKKSGADERT